MRGLAVPALGWVALGGCVVLARPVTPPDNTEATVALLTGTLEFPLDEIARHPWFAVRARGATAWQVWEVGGGGIEDDPFRVHGYAKPMLHHVWRGAEAERAAACIARVAPEIKARIERDYVLYPGPNSNTFGEEVLRACDLHASLPATSVGKDWHLAFVGWTTEGTGVQLDTPIVGLKIGLKEGIELHVLGLSIGIDLWPPAIILPLGPGRLGFADR